MTITTNPARDEYTSSAAQTVFNYTFKIYESTDLNVYVTPVGQTADDATDITTAYTVDPATIGDDAGGFITFTSPLNSGDLVTIVSDIPTDRTVDYQTNGDFSPDTVNNDIDRTVSLVKQVENLATRTVQFQESQQSATGITLPAPSAGDILIWNGTGTGFENDDGTGVAGIAAAAAACAADAASTAADVVTTNADAVTTQADALITTTLTDEFNDLYYGALASDPATAPSGAASTAGDLYFNTTESVMYEYSGVVWQEIATAGLPDGSIAEIKLDAELTAKVNSVGASASRNQVLNQDPMSQGLSQRVGMSSTIYTGNGTSQSINTGVDMATGDFGGLVWVKPRDSADSHVLHDSVRGAGQSLTSNTNGAESTQVQQITSFDSTGFSVGTSGSTNLNAALRVAWSFQTTDKIEPTGDGTELVTNGSFVTDPSVQWTDNANTTVVWDSGNENVDLSASGGSGVYSQAISLTAGVTYIVTMNLSAANSTIDIYTADTIATANQQLVVSGGVGESIGFFTATADDQFITVLLNNTETCTVDDISFQVAEAGYTNRGKPYTAHYNAEMGFSVVGYEGDGVAGHEIPHHLGREPELTIFKGRDNSSSWIVQGVGIGSRANGDYLLLEATSAVANASTVESLVDDLTVTTGTNFSQNRATDNLIQYNFATIEGVSKVGTYIGTGAAGNYVPCGFGDKSAGFVMVKNLTGATSWFMFDASRASSQYLLADTSGAEGTLSTLIEFVTGGFVLKDANGGTNTLNSEYLFLAFADNSGTTGQSQYDYPTTDDVLTIEQDTLISGADGFSASGETNVQENVPAATTMTFGAGFEDAKYYVYKDIGGSYGTTLYRPLEEQDYSGVQTPNQDDVNLRTTAKHFDYESSTGVVSASGEETDYEAYQAFNKVDSPYTGTNTDWRVASTTTSWLQYKHSEPRVLKSWRLLESFDPTETPDNFNIEGSNDGFNWTVIDSTYNTTDFDTVTNGAWLWSPLQDTSGNTTAYLYHRINITANNGDATYTRIGELEFNTETPSDRYDVSEGVMYNYAGTPIQRVYLGELRTDTDGDIINNTIVNYTPNKLKTTDAELHGDLIVRGDISNTGVATAWVNFDGTQNPPLIRSSYNVKDVVDLGAAAFKIVFDTPMAMPEYSVSASAGFKNDSSIVWSTLGEKTTTSTNVHFDSNASGDLEPSDANIQVFGGK